MFYFYGGKRRLVRFYPPPQHRVTVEPFAGSAAYSVLHLVPNRQGVRAIDRAILVEKDPRVLETWERLLEMDADKIRGLPIPSVGDRISDFLFMTAACSNRIARTAEMTVTPRMPIVIKRMLKQVADVMPYVKGRVELIQGDYTSAPDIEATWFIDPPYHVPSRAQSRGMGYAEGCNSAALDYGQLGAWCLARRGQRIVCEQEGATWLPFKHLRHARNSIGNQVTEVVWLSPVPEAEPVKRTASQSVVRTPVAASLGQPTIVSPDGLTS